MPAEQYEFEEIESIRSNLFNLEPRGFEYLIRDLLIHSGFDDVCVTQYSQDGGIDVNAKTGFNMWPTWGMLIQIQAKCWRHSVGRKEVAELRGSLKPYAQGSVITTSHFSKAAVKESKESGKTPIVLVDGYRLAEIICRLKFSIPHTKITDRV